MEVCSLTEIKKNRGTVWRQEHPEQARSRGKEYYAKNSKAIIERNALWMRENPEYTIWHRAKQRALRKQMEFNIEIADVVIPKYCPLLQVEIIYGHGAQSPALDRIDNTKGYVKGNVWVISHKANRMKNDATISELNTFCLNWTQERGLK